MRRLTSCSAANEVLKSQRQAAIYSITWSARVRTVGGVVRSSDLVTSSWQGVLVPSGTPRPIVDKLHAAITTVLADPEIRERMRKGGAITVSSKSPEDFKATSTAKPRSGPG